MRIVQLYAIHAYFAKNLSDIEIPGLPVTVSMVLQHSCHKYVRHWIISLVLDLCDAQLPPSDWNSLIICHVK